MSNNIGKPFNPLPYLSPLAPVTIQKELLFLFGWDKATLFQHIHYWVTENAANELNFHDGRYWTYDSILALQMEFPWLTEHQIRYHLGELVKLGVIIEGDYSTNRMERPKWYTVDFEKYVEFINERQEELAMFIKNCLAPKKGKNGSSRRAGKNPNSNWENSQMELGKTPSVIITESYNSNNKNKELALENEIHEEKNDGELVDPNFQLSNGLREEVEKQYPELLDPQIIPDVIKTFIDNNTNNQTRRHEWDKWFIGHCKWYKTWRYKKKKSKSPADMAPTKTPAQELWSRILQYCVPKVKGSDGFGYLKVVDLYTDYLTVDALESERSKVDVQRCGDLIRDALDALKTQIKRVEFKWQ